MFALVRQLSQATGADDWREITLGAILLNKLLARIRSLVYDKTSHSHNVTPTELLNLLTDIIRKEAVMDVMEPAFPSSAVETGRYDCMVAANSARNFPMAIVCFTLPSGIFSRVTLPTLGM
ncbi:hypothetical protein KIN20_024793 [Parelaphostrongylus tenuis]|uniref:Uncharacterized protein n=1 Tax=Parelaphostrongylus tenuis TaxID=148309 RepID=A0AAD5QW80_PARTN|nr:hypothetical protein KIN20_024793 [Parelaphostrongylus tenuis]